MPRDPDGRAFLQCSDCGDAVWHKDGQDHCGCDPEPDGYRIGSLGEVVSQFDGEEVADDSV